MPIINRLPINSNNGNEHNKVTVTRQKRKDKNYATFRSYDSFSIVSTVVVHSEDGGLWTLGTVVERGDHIHSNRSYMIRISKTG